METTDGFNGMATDRPTRSVSDHQLKSVTHLTNQLVDNSTDRPVINGKCGTQDWPVRNGHRLPSYVGISCAISGYCDYNRYTSSLRTTSSLVSTRPDISVALKNSTEEPVNRLNESLNRKNSLISEALITSRHNVNEDIDTNGSEDLKNNDFNCNLNNNKNNSLLEQRIASLYGQTFAKDWRESRTKTRHKSSDWCPLNKQRSPSCPPTQKSTQIQIQTQIGPQMQPKTQPKPQPKPQLIPQPIPQPMADINKTDNHFDTQKKTPEPMEPLVPQSSDQLTDINQMTAKVVKQVLSSNGISDNGNTNSCESGVESTVSKAKDGNWFLDELNKTTEEIKEKIDLTEGMLQNQCNLMGDEMSGKLRAAVGKANLLINKKFKQFRELCAKNISQTDEQFITTNDDLEGFWDMVSIQVLDIKETFAEIDRLCANGWKAELELPKNMTSTPLKVRSRKSTPKGSPDKSCDESNTDRESERRNRLKEAKRRARLKASQTDEEITIFIPNPKQQ